jgi:CelD/BcsL family acetyltransferase involved in cellulose biosynthesis
MDHLTTAMPPTKSDSKVSSEVVTDFARLEELASEWDNLWNADALSQIFQSFGWIRAWWNGFGAGFSLCCPAVHVSGKLAGIFPLVFKDHTLQFLGSPESDYNDVLCGEGLAEKVVPTLLGALFDLPFAWKRCFLTNVPAASHILQYLGRAPEMVRKRTIVMRGHTCPTILLGGDNRREVLDQLCRKQSLRRHENRLQKRGNLTFRHVEERDDIRHHLGTLFKQHIQRCAMMGEKSKFLRSECRNFYECLVRELDPSKQLRFSVLEVDGHPVAYHFGFQAKDRFLWYKPTFSVDYWDDSPGEVLLRRLLQYAQGADVREFDFTAGDENFKFRFANHFRHNYVLELDATATGGLQSSIRCSLGRGKKWVKERLDGIPLSRKVLIFLSGDRLQKWMRRNILAKWGRAFCGHDEVVIFSRGGEISAKSIPAVCRPDVQIVQGNLGELALLAAKYPDSFDKERLKDYRERFKKGHRAYLACVRGEASCMVWMAICHELRPFYPDGEYRLELNRPSVLFYDYWVAPGYRDEGIPVGLLLGALKSSDSNSSSVWTYCRRRSRQIVRQIERAGFTSRYHVRPGSRPAALHN